MDDLLAFSSVVAVLIVLAVAFPSQFRQSLLRWLGEPPPAPAKPAPVDVEALAARLRHLVQPTLLLFPAEQLGFSKLGGDPELPEGVPWPAGYRQPRAFLFQIDLRELPKSAIDWLPTDGRLHGFYDPDSHGLADVVCVLHSTDAAGSPVLAPRGVRLGFLERRVGFRALMSAPSLDWLGLNDVAIALSEEQSDDLDAIGDAPPSDEVQHRIGGYPNEIQPERMWLSCEHLARGLPEPSWEEEIPPAIERAAKEWRLLLQIDSDPALKMNFGDGGRLYVFVRERHARRGDFSKTVTLWQTY